MGPTGPSARRAPYFFFFLAAFFFFAIVSPPSAPRVPRVGSICGDSTGSPRRVSRRKYTMKGVFNLRPPHLGGGALLADGRRLAVLATTHELLVQRHALLAHRTLLGRIRRKVAAHEAEDLLARDLRLLGAPPE